MIFLNLKAKHNLAFYNLLCGDLFRSLTLKSFYKFLVFFFGAIQMLICTSCGYQFGYGDRSLPEGVKSVYIPIFENDSYQTGAEVQFTNALIAEIHDSKIARIAPVKKAEATLKGRVIRVDFEQANIDSRRRDEEDKSSGIRNLPRGTVITTEYLARVTVEVQMFKDNKLVWKQWLRDERLYDAPQLGLEGINTANANYNRTARETVVKDLARVMMHELYGRLTENF
jgi:hypothetical protein